MGLEVGHRHLAAGQEPGDSGQQAKRDQEPAEELDEPGRQHQRIGSDPLAVEPPEQLLGTMEEEEESGDDPEQGGFSAAARADERHDFIRAQTCAS